MTPGGIYGTLLAVTHGPPGSGHAPVKLRSHTLHRLWSMIWGTLGANAANADCAHGDLGADPVRPLAALALRSPLHKPASLGTAGKIGGAHRQCRSGSIGAATSNRSPDSSWDAVAVGAAC